MCVTAKNHEFSIHQPDKGTFAAALRISERVSPDFRVKFTGKNYFTHSHIFLNFKKDIHTR